MSKIEIDLKDDFEIEVDGYSYNVPRYEVSSKGLEKVFGSLKIEFVRGSKIEDDEVVPQEGTLHEHLLAVMIHDLKLKNDLVRSKETSMVITKLEEALMWQQRRSIDRARRAVQETYKK